MSFSRNLNVYFHGKEDILYDIVAFSTIIIIIIIDIIITIIIIIVATWLVLNNPSVYCFESDM